MSGNSKWKLCCVLMVAVLVQLACSGATSSSLQPTVAASPSPTLESTRVLPTSTRLPTNTPSPTSAATATARPSATATAVALVPTATRLPTRTPTQSVPPTPPFSSVTQLDQWALLMAPSDYSPATTSLVFRVKACATCKVNDPKKIPDADDGKGIKNVEFVIVKIISQNPYKEKEVYRQTEGTKFYCAFGGGEPICNVLVFAENPKGWPGKNEPFDGDYRMEITVRPTQGEELARETFFSIKVKK